MTATELAKVSEVKPGNISATQLGAMLSKSSQAGEGKQTPEKKRAAAASETPPPQEEAGGAPEQTQTEQEQTEETERAEETPAAEETETPAAEETETPEVEETETPNNERPTPNAEVEETAPKELDAELQGAIADAKAAGETGIAKLLKRLSTVVDRRDTERLGRLNAEREAGELRSQLQELQSKPAPPANGSAAEASDPVAGHPAMQQVSRELAQADAMEAWAEANPDGGQLPDGKGGVTEFDAGQVKAIRKNAQRIQAELVARKATTEAGVRQAWTEAHSGFHTHALKAYPDYARKDSTLNVELRNFTQVMPGLRAFPDHELVVGDYIRGRTARLAEEKAKTNGRPAAAKIAARPPAKVVADRGAAPAEELEEKKPGTKEQKQFEKTGRMSDLKKAFAARRMASTRR